MTIPQAVQAANYTQQDRFAQRIIDYYSKKTEQVKLCVWGLAFKARTDDVRESPAIRCIEKLVKAGIKVTAYDPEAMSAALEELNGQIETVNDAYTALDDADGLVILTDWQEFRTPDFELISSKLKRPVIFDGRNLYSGEYVQMQGLEYYSIGRTGVQNRKKA
jgi:UDPglucose 6-dehydrogenase